MKKNILLLLFLLQLIDTQLISQTFSNGTNVAIPDNNTATNSVIAVSGLGTSLNCSTPLGLTSVCIKISHTYDEDLDIYLISPTGTQIILSTDNGGTGNHYGNATADDNGPYTCFDMSAATAVTAGTAPFANTYRPEGTFASFNNGQNPNGNWTLRVFDDTGGDVGTILYWQLTFATTGITCPTPPACASGTTPADGAEICATAASVTMAWTATAGATGYNFYLGTDNPPTNIVNGTYQTTTSYVYSALTSGFTYYWQAIPVNDGVPASNCALQSFNVVPCINMSTGTSTTCSAGFYDSGGPTGNYGNSQNFTRTICPANAGECIQSTFYNFRTESGYDYLYVYDGNSTAAPQVSGSPFSGNLASFSVVGTTTNATGCLTFRYISDGSTTSSGWDASIICAPCASAATYPPQDCSGGTTVCSDQAFAGNSDGQGIVNDLNTTNRGCLSTEHQSSWYYFSPATSGTIQLAITPANGIDDYDFAIWGPMASVSCPPSSAPLRCSYSALDGVTGLNLTAPDVSEGVGGDKWVDELNVTAGQVFILCVDNYSASTQPFTLDWTLTNGATLSCTPLPIELLSFKGQQEGKKNLLEWITASEINNDFFTIEKSTDGHFFEQIGIVDGAGTSNQNRNYQFYDNEPLIGINYYRIKQTDFDGTTSLSGIIGIENIHLENSVSNIHPNPTNKDFSFDFYSPINGTVKIQVLDYTGRIVLNDLASVSEGKTTLGAEIGNLANGVYSLKVVFEQTGFTVVNMLIKQ